MCSGGSIGVEEIMGHTGSIGPVYNNDFFLTCEHVGQLLLKVHKGQQIENIIVHPSPKDAEEDIPPVQLGRYLIGKIGDNLDICICRV